MAKTVASLNIQIGATTATLKRDLERASSSVRQFGRSAQGTAANVAKFRSSVSSTIATITKFIGVVAAFRAVKFGIRLAAEAETAEIAFKTMLGSAALAKKTIGEIRDFAAATPFQTADLIAASRSLIAFGESASTVVSTLRRIGDVSAGVSAPIGEIATLYGKARVQGRLFAEDINQLTGRGIPIIQELAKQFGVADSEVKKLVESGVVNFGHLEEAFRSLTSEGGTFFGLTEAQSKSLAGVISTLKDNISLLVLEVGTKALPVLKNMAEGALTLTDAVRNLDLETVRNTVKWGAFAIALGSALRIIPKIVAGIKTVIVALRAMTTAQAIATAFGGPAGWATLAASVAIAAGAAVGVAKAFDTLTESSEEAKAATAEVAKATEAVADASADIEKVTKSFDEAKAAADKWSAIGDRIRDSVKTPLEGITEKLVDIRQAFLEGAIDAGTYALAIRKARDEIFDLSTAGRDAFSSPDIGAAVRGTSGGIAAVSESEKAMRKIAETARKELESAKAREALLEDIHEELKAIKRKEPIKVTEHTIV